MLDRSWTDSGCKLALSLSSDRPNPITTPPLLAPVLTLPKQEADEEPLRTGEEAYPSTTHEAQQKQLNRTDYRYRIRMTMSAKNPARSW